MDYGKWEPVIGLEIHAQLKTASKIFCNASTKFDAGENENTSPVTLGLPGSLPVINSNAIDLGIKAGLALGCEIQKHSVFSRKNYFYPDLAKGYQISQHTDPICGPGKVEFILNGAETYVRIHRAHLEEDAGKSTHHGNYSLINYNRAGVPLLEIVSEPEIHSAQEAAEYARMVRRILRYADVCDGNLEEGSLRCDCNVSVRAKGDNKLGTKVELKNINSFRFIEKAIEYEILRQIDKIESKEKIIQETRLYDSTKNKTYSMRSKEEAEDYRYFPDPDLLPVIVTEKRINQINSLLPELPIAKIRRFTNTYGLREAESEVLTEEIEIAEYFEEVVSVSNSPKSSAAWVTNDLMGYLNEEKKKINETKCSAQKLGDMIRLIEDGTISGKIAKKVFSKILETGDDANSIIKAEGWVQVSDTSSIEKVIEEVIKENGTQVEEYRSGKTKVFGFFVGQVMKKMKGQGNPAIVNQLLKKKLEE